MEPTVKPRMSDPMPVVDTGYPDVNQVARELEITPLHVNRLIARKTLPTNRIGDDGPFRVARSALQAYIAKNAPDLAPVVRIDGQWFLSDDAAMAARFEQAFNEAAADQVLPDKEAVKLFSGANRLATSVFVPVKLTPKVLAAIGGPVPRPHLQLAGQPEDTRYPSWRALYVAEKLRNTAYAFAIRAGMKGTGLPPIAALYQSPEAYDQVVADAKSVVLRRNIGFSRIIRLDRPTGEQFGTVFYGLPLKDLAAPDVWKAAISLAF